MNPTPTTGAKAPDSPLLPKFGSFVSNKPGHERKKLHGQFYTTTNPFSNDLFLKWLKQVPADIRSSVWLEPFAGSNHIVKMLDELEHRSQWACFDINPGVHNAAPQFPIQVRDTLKDFPAPFELAITNPPYLAKNSASRDGLAFPDCAFDDLYKYALSVMLDRVGYVAAIIPESFLTTGLFHDRLFGVATLNCRMFEDTDCPVCLAMFLPAGIKQDPKNFDIYKGNVRLGTYAQLCERKDALLHTRADVRWRFNEHGGTVGLYAVDSQKERSIRFVPGKVIADDRVKVSSRSVTKIGGVPKGVSSASLIEAANDLLSQFRDRTSDVFLTAFKGMRADGDYRRRLDYSLARHLLNASVDQVRGVRHA